MKNIFELKNARRVLVENNLFENNWVHAQSGFAILFTVRTENGKMPWAAVEDITFVHNVIRHSAGGFNITGHDDNKQGHGRRILIRNNVLEDISPDAWGGCGRLFQILSRVESLTIDHNTCFDPSFVTCADGDPSPGVVFTNNIIGHGRLGVAGSGKSAGNATIEHYFPGSVFRKNLFVGAPPHVKPLQYPPDNFFVAGPDAVKFVEWKAGNYRLTPESPYCKAGTDGKDLGVEFIKP